MHRSIRTSTTAVIQRAREILDRELAVFRERTPRSAQWLADAERVMPGGVPMAWMRSLYRHAPVVAVRGSGSRFEDLDGNTLPRLQRLRPRDAGRFRP